MDTNMQKVNRAENTAVENDNGVIWLNPQLDIIEKDRGLEILADMPGVNKNDVEITWENNALLINAQAGLNRNVDGAKQKTYKYKRAIKLSNKFDANNISAKMQQGVLTLHVARKPEQMPRTITVQ